MKRRTAKRQGNARARKADVIYEELKKEILTCLLAPGTVLTQEAVAERFDVSTTPAREALNHLVGDGYTQVLPRRGYLIAPISLHDFGDLFHVRKLLEVNSVELAAQQASEVEIAEIEGLADFPTVQEEDSAIRFFERNQDFHIAIARASRNRVLGSLVQDVLEKLYRVLFYDLQQLNLGPEIEDHRRIAAMLRQGDERGSRDAMLAHFERLRGRIIDGIIPATLESG